MNYEYWRQHGVYFASDEQKIKDFLTNQYPNFNLEQVLSELEQAAAARQFEWDRVQIQVTTRGNLHIQHHFDPGNHDEEPLSLRRILMVPSDNGRRASHEEMILPESMQRKGLSRYLIRPYYNQYKVSGVDFIDAYAGANGGGYALARYGFDAVNQEDIIKILIRAQTLGIDSEALNILAEDVKRFYESNPHSAPFRIHEWSQTPFGEKLLAGTYWKAVLDLHNSDQLDIFEEYLDSEP
jgi:hypothetical protein